MSLSTQLSAPSATQNSPVEMSRNATPVVLRPKHTDARNVFSLLASMLSPSATPGVTSSITPRLTSPLTCLGSSSCSQMATRSPARTSLGRQVSTAWQGNPASSTQEAAPLARRVSVMPRIPLALIASSPKVSQKSPPRKSRMASGWTALTA